MRADATRHAAAFSAFSFAILCQRCHADATICAAVIDIFSPRHASRHFRDYLRCALPRGGAAIDFAALLPTIIFADNIFIKILKFSRYSIRLPLTLLARLPIRAFAAFSPSSRHA